MCEQHSDCDRPVPIPRQFLKSSAAPSSSPNPNISPRPVPKPRRSVDSNYNSILGRAPSTKDYSQDQSDNQPLKTMPTVCGLLTPAKQPLFTPAAPGSAPVRPPRKKRAQKLSGSRSTSNLVALDAQKKPEPPPKPRRKSLEGLADGAVTTEQGASVHKCNVSRPWHPAGHSGDVAQTNITVAPDQTVDFPSLSDSKADKEINMASSKGLARQLSYERAIEDYNDRKPHDTAVSQILSESRVLTGSAARINTDNDVTRRKLPTPPPTQSGDHYEDYVATISVARESVATDPLLPTRVKTHSKFYVEIENQEHEDDAAPIYCGIEELSKGAFDSIPRLTADPENRPVSMLSNSSDDYIIPGTTRWRYSSQSTSSAENSAVISRSSSARSSRSCDERPHITEMEDNDQKTPVPNGKEFIEPCFNIGEPNHASSHVDSDSEDNASGELTEEQKQRKKKKAFLVAQEILSSEKTFVDVLRLLTVDFRGAVEKANQAIGRPVVPAQILSKILNNLPQLQSFNALLVRDLTERILNWSDKPKLADIFVKKGPFLKLYSSYIQDFQSCAATLDDTRKTYPDFGSICSDFEASPRCKNMLLKHYMLKPIQRIPQYRLLLTDYQKNLLTDSPDFEDTNAALVIVSGVAEHANQSMKYGDNFKKLWEIQHNIIGQFEVITPGRYLIKEGILEKLSRKEKQPLSGNYRLNHIISVSNLHVVVPRKEDFNNEFSIISEKRSFTVLAKSEEERDDWISAFREASKENVQKRYSFQPNSYLHLVDLNLDEDMELGTKAPVWIPDARVSMCMLCTAEFTVTFRRHHCRACGKVICTFCSDYQVALKYLQNKMARVCRECHKVLAKDGDAEISTPSQNTFEKFQHRLKGIQIPTFRNSKRKSRASVLNEVSANDDTAIMSGYLKEWKGTKWKKRWYVVKDKALYRFKDKAAMDSTVLLGYEIRPMTSYFEGVEPALIFELLHPGTPPKIFRTESSASCQRWISAVTEATLP